MLTAGSTRTVAGEWSSVVYQGLALASAGLFWAGLTPPRFLLASWRRPDEAHLDQAVQRLVAATSHDEITDALLPHLVRVVGAGGAALIDEEQRVLRSYGDVPLPDALDDASRRDNAAGPASPHRIDFSVRSGRLSLWVSPYTPFFGQERICLAELEREAQQALVHERDFSQRLVEAERQRDRFAGHVQRRRVEDASRRWASSSDSATSSDVHSGASL